MSKGNDPAFFQVLPPDHHWNEGFNPKGLTKREHFAGLAMQGLCGSLAEINRIGEQYDVDSVKILSELSVKYADALLKALGEE